MEKSFFSNFFEPFIEKAAKELDISMKDLESINMRKTDKERILNEIQKVVCRTGFRCLLLEFHVCNQSGKLGGKDIKEKLDCYQNVFLSDIEYRKSVLRIYPELEGICQGMAEKQIILIQEMFQRLRMDKREIEEKLLDGKMFREVKKIHMGEGDPHCGGRSVIKLCLDCGISIFYKFYSTVNDKVFYGLMDRIEKQAICDMFCIKQHMCGMIYKNEGSG